MLKRYIISSHTVMVTRYCCLVGVHVQSFRPRPWPSWVSGKVFRTWIPLVSSLSLLRPPEISSSGSKPSMDSSCTLTFDPGIVISMRLLDSSKDTLSGPCASLKASASLDTAFDQDANLDIPVALLTQHVVCLMSALSLCANSQKYMLTDQAMAAFLPEKDQSRGKEQSGGILVLLESREEFFTNVELDVLGTLKCLMPHYVSYLSEIKAATVHSLVLFGSAVHEAKLHWFQFVQSTTQVDKGNRRAANPFLSNFCQIWLFTALLRQVYALDW